MSQTDLGLKAVVSTGTIQNIEAGARCYSRTLNRIATALGVKYTEIRIPDESLGAVQPAADGGDKPGNDDVVVVEIRIGKDIKTLDATRELAEWFTKLIVSMGATGNPEVINMHPGSTRLWVEMSRGDYARLVALVASGGSDIGGIRLLSVRMLDPIFFEVFTTIESSLAQKGIVATLDTKLNQVYSRNLGLKPKLYNDIQNAIGLSIGAGRFKLSKGGYLRNKTVGDLADYVAFELAAFLEDEKDSSVRMPEKDRPD